VQSGAVVTITNENVRMVDKWWGDRGNGRNKSDGGVGGWREV
jgi:hypothetical protein